MPPFSGSMERLCLSFCAEPRELEGRCIANKRPDFVSRNGRFLYATSCSRANMRATGHCERDKSAQYPRNRQGMAYAQTDEQLAR